MANTFQSSGNPHISERRMHWRQKVFFSRVELGENNRGDLLNISPSGLALQAVEELTDDELPKMRFQLSQAPAWIEAKGRIAWRDDSKKVAGVEFIDLSPETRKQILLSIILTSDESEFPKTDSAIAANVTTGSGVEAVPEDRSQQSIISSVQSPSERPNAELASENAKATNVTRGSRKAGWLVGLSLAAVLLVFAILPLRHYLQKAGTSQKGRETITEPDRPGLSSKISATPSSNPGPTPDHSAPTSNAGPAPDHLAFVLQVGAMANEENANALAASLSQLNFPAFVFRGPTDRLDHVFVGPFTSVDATLTVKKDLERRGFKAFRKEWKPHAL